MAPLIPVCPTPQPRWISVSRAVRQYVSLLGYVLARHVPDCAAAGAAATGAAAATVTAPMAYVPDGAVPVPLPSTRVPFHRGTAGPTTATVAVVPSGRFQHHGRPSNGYVLPGSMAAPVMTLPTDGWYEKLSIATPAELLRKS